MKDSLIIRIVLNLLCIFLIVFPSILHADEIDSKINKIEPIESVKSTKKMTKQEMNDLFGEDPYLGQTSYLQSPDGFSYREKSE